MSCLLAIAACDLHLGSQAQDGGPDAPIADGSATCPTNPSAVVGMTCSPEGQVCDNGKCAQACTICNAIQCQGGKWVSVEAFPDPRCNDGGLCSQLNQACSTTQPCCAGFLVCLSNLCVAYEPDMAGSCAQGCTFCGAGSTCLVGTGNTMAACLPSCTTDDDCVTFVASRCMSVITNPQDFPQRPPFSYSPRVCISWPSGGTPSPNFCPGVATTTHCDISSPPTCDDATTLVTYTDAPGTCGKEFVHCKNGCQEVPTDLGLRQAACQ